MLLNKLKYNINYSPIAFESSKWAHILLWIISVIVVCFRLFGIFDVGLTTFEADTLARYSASDLFFGLSDPECRQLLPIAENLPRYRSYKKNRGGDKNRAIGC